MALGETMDNVVVAFGMTVMAGLCTGIGSLIAFLSKSTNRVFLSVSLGFSAGVMLYVSMIEIFVKAEEILCIELGESNGGIVTTIAFFMGMILMAVIEKSLNSPIYHNEKEESTQNLMRMGTFTAIAIGIHNLPEGLATFISAMQEPEVAIPIVVAIAMHNIPEGIAVSVPVYYATGSKKKAFLYSVGSGLSEPMGALLGWVILMPIMSDLVYGVIFAGVAGIMVFISLEELLPTAMEYGERHLVMYGVVGGMIVMAMSLLLA